MNVIYQICPQCKGTGINPRDEKQKCSWAGCKGGYVPWGKIVEEDEPKKAKK